MKKSPVFLGGGFLRSVISNEKPSDIDLFGPSKDMLERAATGLALSRKARLHSTDNAFTVLTPGRTPVQFIHRWLYEQPEKLVDEFDFTIARAAVWWNQKAEHWCSICDQDYYADLAARRLIYCCPKREEDAGGSLMRVRKFLSKGFWIGAHDLGLVVARLMSGVKDTTETDWLENVIIGLLREVDPLTVVDGVDIVDEHATVPTEGDETAE